jgi:hypothetical protein
MFITKNKLLKKYFNHQYLSKCSVFFKVIIILSLAYGITGSGKTHTVFGSHERNQKGICGLALNYLLKKKK